MGEYDCCQPFRLCLSTAKGLHRLHARKTSHDPTTSPPPSPRHPPCNFFGLPIPWLSHTRTLQRTWSRKDFCSPKWALCRDPDAARRGCGSVGLRGVREEEKRRRVKDLAESYRWGFLSLHILSPILTRVVSRSTRLSRSLAPVSQLPELLCPAPFRRSLPINTCRHIRIIS